MQISHLGFFDGPSEGQIADPIGSLRCALSTVGTGSGIPEGALIVLPEAFNLAEPYWRNDRDVPIRDPRIRPEDALAEIQRFAMDSKIRFVVGLLEHLHSVAYLVDPERGAQRMCRKTTEDGSGTYVPALGPDDENPTTLEDSCIGALICADALCQKRVESLHEQMRKIQPRTRILCVPAHMNARPGPFEPDYWTVLASSGARRGYVRSPTGEELIGGSGRGKIFLASCRP